MTMSCTLKKNEAEAPKEEQEKMVSVIRGVPLKPGFFVDDLEKTAAQSEELRVNGKVITSTLDELGLDAHPDKSGILVFGRRREKIKREGSRYICSQIVRYIRYITQNKHT